MADFNLLPKDKTLSEKAIKTNKLLTKVAIATGVAFLLITAAGTGAYFLLNHQLNVAKQKQSDLTTSVQNLQSTEAGLILIKDRVQKVDSVLAARSSETSFEKQKSILDSAGGDISFKTSDIDTSRSVLELSSTSSLELLNLMQKLNARDDFATLYLNELLFNPLQGYTAKFEVF